MAKKINVGYIFFFLISSYVVIELLSNQNYFHCKLLLIITIFTKFDKSVPFFPKKRRYSGTPNKFVLHNRRENRPYRSCLLYAS